MTTRKTPARKRPAAAGTGLLQAVSAALPALRKSEQKVAHVVLSDPQQAMGSSMAELAGRAKVSEPTVMRFCSAVGCTGFQEFKLRLAQSLALGIPATQSTIVAGDDAAAIAGKVFDYSITSLDHARRALDPRAIERAVDLICAAQSLLFLGLGASGIVAQDAQQKFPLFGVPCHAPVDLHQQFMAASLAGPQDAVVAISNTGRSVSIVESAATARKNGAAVIGICGADGPLHAVCDVIVLVETLENTDFYTPTISRLAQLVIIDILATGVVLQRDERYIERLRTMKENLTRMRTGSA